MRRVGLIFGSYGLEAELLSFLRFFRLHLCSLPIILYKYGIRYH